MYCMIETYYYEIVFKILYIVNETTLISFYTYHKIVVEYLPETLLSPDSPSVQDFNVIKSESSFVELNAQPNHT